MMAYEAPLAHWLASDQKMAAETQPSTDLESFLSTVRGSAKYAEEINERVASILIKLRGSLPPSGPETNVSKMPAPANGILGELHDAVSRVQLLHSSTYELLTMIQSAV